MFHSKKSDAIADVLCDCPEIKQEDTCLFCWYPAVGAYRLVENRSTAFCPRCHRRENNTTYYFHIQCANAVKKWCSVLADNKNSLESTVTTLLSCTRALTQPHAIMDDAEVLLNYFFDSPTRPMIDKRLSWKKLQGLPREIKRLICEFLTPVPELVAVAQTERLLALVDNPSQVQPLLTYIEGISPGKSLYLTFAVFRGVRYLSSISEEGKEPPHNSHLFKVSGTSLIVCRDHFAIFDLCCADSRAVRTESWDNSAYYSIIDLGNRDGKGVAFLAYSDGLFLRTLVPASDNSPTVSYLVERNTPTPAAQNVVMSFSRSLYDLRLGAFKRWDYHDLVNITGISAAVRNSKTVGLFIHRWGSEKRSFKSFTAKLHHLFPNCNIMFMFFPIARQEEIRAVGLRRLKDLRFPGCCPAIQVSTSYGRTCVFGPTARARSEDLFEYEAAWSKAGEAIEGLYHSPVSRRLPAFEEVGVSIRNDYVISTECNICPIVDIPCPSLGAPDLDWCLSKVCVDSVTTLQICKASIAENSCLGVLLTYTNGCKECLGQIRFDKYLSEPIKVQDCYFLTQEIDRILSVSVRAYSQLCTMNLEQGWVKFPMHGNVSWWFGPIGDTMSLD